MRCVGCGYCCMKVPCFVAVRLHGSGVRECPQLKWEDGRYVCSLMVGDSAIAREYRRELFAGVGCCSGMNDWRRDVKPRRGEENVSVRHNPLPREMQIFLRCLGGQFISSDAVYLACLSLGMRLVKEEGWEDGRAREYVAEIWKAFKGNVSSSTEQFMG